PSSTRPRGSAPGDTDLFRPVLFALLSAEKVVFGPDLGGPQVIGILLHCIVCLLLLTLFRQIVNLCDGSSDKGESPPRPIAASLFPFALTGFFALNPGVQELVIWTHLHGYLLFLVFLLGSLALLIRHASGPAAGKLRSPCLWGSWVLALLAAFTYELGQCYAVLAGLFLAAAWCPTSGWRRGGGRGGEGGGGVVGLGRGCPVGLAGRERGRHGGPRGVVPPRAQPRAHPRPDVHPADGRPLRPVRGVHHDPAVLPLAHRLHVCRRPTPDRRVALDAARTAEPRPGGVGLRRGGRARGGARGGWAWAACSAKGPAAAPGVPPGGRALRALRRDDRARADEPAARPVRAVLELLLHVHRAAVRPAGRVHRVGRTRP